MIGVIVLICMIAFAGYFLGTQRGRDYVKRSRQQSALVAKARAPKRITQVGVKTPGGLACPKCGGTSFAAGRKTSTKLLFGASSMLGQAKHVRCVTCGTQFARG